jgi:hypothetical protein
MVVKESEFRALALMLEWYVQSTETAQCSLCSVMFLVLLDPDARAGQGMRESDNQRRAIAFFREKIPQDHADGHKCDHFVMP